MGSSFVHKMTHKAVVIAGPTFITGWDGPNLACPGFDTPRDLFITLELIVAMPVGLYSSLPTHKAGPRPVALSGAPPDGQSRPHASEASA
jgi:hypothetical protein